jgi:hypothetical protein
MKEIIEEYGMSLVYAVIGLTIAGFFIYAINSFSV